MSCTINKDSMLFNTCWIWSSENPSTNEISVKILIWHIDVVFKRFLTNSLWYMFSCCQTLAFCPWDTCLVFLAVSALVLYDGISVLFPQLGKLHLQTNAQMSQHKCKWEMWVNSASKCFIRPFRLHSELVTYIFKLPSTCANSRPLYRRIAWAGLPSLPARPVSWA